MIEKFISYTKRYFPNGPKAKKSITAVAILLVALTVILNISMKKTLTISIDGEEKTFVTYNKGTIKDVLTENGINLGEKDKIEPSLESKVSKNQKIKIKKAVPVKVTVNDAQVELLTAEDTVQQMLDAEKDTLEENGIDFNKESDEVNPSLDAKVEENLSIKIDKIETKQLVENHVITFDTIVEKDSSLDSSVEKVKSNGNNGQKEVTYNVVYKNGQEVSRDLMATKVLKEPENKVVVKGTGNVYASRGTNVSYKSKMSCEATAYSGHSTTATGRTPVRNPGGLSTIAVDPSVIPLGSKVYVEGYGYAIAADTGGAIKGNKIDIYVDSSSEARSWGRRHVDVLLIAYPGQW